MRYKSKKGFSLLELLVTMFLFSVVSTGVFTFYISYINSATQLANTMEVENSHSRFQHLLEKKKNCSVSLKGLKNGDLLDLTKESSIQELQDNLKNVRDHAKPGVALKEVTLNIADGRFFQGRGYAYVKFKYVYRHNAQAALKETTKNARVFLKLKEGAVDTCLDLSQESQCSSTSFLTSFNQASLQETHEQKIGETDEQGNIINAQELQEGMEHIYSSSNLYKGKIGEYCLSHNICHKGQWRSKSICYDSCRGKFWRDGLLNFEDDKKNLNSKEEDKEFFCKAKSFDFGVSCAGEYLRKAQLKEKKYNEIEFHSETIYLASATCSDGSRQKRGYFEAIFKCSYAGTWELVYAKCIKYKDPCTLIPDQMHHHWDINPLDPIPDNDQLRCASSSHHPSFDILSYDKTQREKVNIGNIYPGKKFNIGQPKRLVINFKEDKTSTATVACVGDGKSKRWKQIGDTVRNCEGLTNPLPKTDIVFVVDNSGSMEDNQEALGASVDRFLDRFFAETAQKINYTFYVTTTDTTDDIGVWKGGREIEGVIKTNGVIRQYKKKDFQGREHELKVMLKQALEPGIDGAYTERPIANALKVLKTYRGEMNSFSTLAFFFLTDEDSWNPFNSKHPNPIYLANQEPVERQELEALVLQIKKGDKTKVITRGFVDIHNIQDPEHGQGGDVTPFVQSFNGSLFEVESTQGYGDQMVSFADEIIAKTLIIGN